MRTLEAEGEPAGCRPARNARHRRLGLLRRINGRLLPTKACSDDVEMVRRLRRGFPEDSFETLLVTSALAVLTTGSLTDDERMERVLPTMGRGWTDNGDPLNATVLRSAWWGQCALLRALDMLAETPHAKPVVLGPSALTLLPRATGLADPLTKGASM